MKKMNMTSVQLEPDKLFMGANGNADKNKLCRLLDKVDSPISNTSPAALWVTDQYKENIFLSNTWLRWTANSFNDQLNGSWFSAILKEDRAKVVMHFLECFDERKKFVAEFRIPCNDGNVRWCLTEAKPYFDIAGSFAGYAGSVTDITEIKTLEQRKDEKGRGSEFTINIPLDYRK